MGYWDALGRTLIAEDTKESANRIADFLSYSGVDAIVSSAADEADSPLYSVTVPNEQKGDAQKLMDAFRQSGDDRAQRAASYRENCLRHSPTFIPSEEKFRYSTNSSTIFFIAGVAVVLLALIHFFVELFHQRQGAINGCILELVLGFFFVMFAITTHQKVRYLEDQILEENAFTDSIIRWCTTIYPADHLDKCIDAASDGEEISDEERSVRRRQLIQNYILREYDISDTAYLDYITDTIYKKLYFPNAVSSAITAQK